ncbi:MAG: nucleoside triphosphate pyrophosphohydrolase [Bdellovibrionales bacterium]|nr:nucleoside triphosphate pyrophosphohydrolase [Bdellovibrionales bacterium]
MPTPPKNLKDFKSLVQVIEDLRGPEGCPWDKEQNLETLTRYAIEEAHEYAQAVHSETPVEVKDELGDMLLQVVLNTQIARELGWFEIEDVIENLNQKMIRRHPHVFSKTKVSGVDEVWKNWEEIKLQEKKGQKAQRPFSEIPGSLPATLRSHKLGSKSKKFNFDWENVKQVFAKVTEEHQELKQALEESESEHIQEELGDLMFSLCQLARHLGTDAETCLAKANKKFESRFIKMWEQNPDLKKLSTDELENLWIKAKSST